MSLYPVLRKMVERYMLGDPSMLPKVREWLYSHADELLDSTDTDLRELADVVWSRISDYDVRDITEPEVREGIALEFPDLARKEDLRPAASTTPLAGSTWTIEIAAESSPTTDKPGDKVRDRLETRLRSPEVRVDIHRWGSRSPAPAGR
ncbi:MAG TPA: hypothetical protein VFX49_13865 [Chloroflexota bacterium]|nr:hypothetical protein [Chloroflexota bacterium]